MGLLTDMFLETVHQRPNVVPDPPFFGVHIFHTNEVRGLFQVLGERRRRNLSFDEYLSERDFDPGLISDIAFFRHIRF